MADVRELEPAELDSEGFPTDTITLDHLPDGGWIATCEKLPGYAGWGDSQTDALAKLRETFAAEETIYRVMRLRPKSAVAQRKVIAHLVAGGGSDAPDAWLKPDTASGVPLGVSPTTLFQARSKWREAEQLLGFKISNAMQNFDNSQWLENRLPQFARWIEGGRAIAEHKRRSTRNGTA